MRVRKILISIPLALLVWPAMGALANGPSSVKMNTAPADELREMVRRVSTELGLDPRLVDALVRVESAYNPWAVSRRGALGLMQLMPDTARRLDVDDPFDPPNDPQPF